MKIDTTQAIIGWDWEPAANQTGEITLTVKWAIQMICNTPVNSEPFTPEGIMKCADLASRAYQPEPDYSDEERQFILKRSEKLCAERMNTPIVHHFLHDLFDSSLASVSQLAPPEHDEVIEADVQ